MRLNAFDPLHESAFGISTYGLLKLELVTLVVIPNHGIDEASPARILWFRMHISMRDWCSVQNTNKGTPLRLVFQHASRKL
jgi:hypothetical protein